MKFPFNNLQIPSGHGKYLAYFRIDHLICSFADCKTCNKKKKQLKNISVNKADLQDQPKKLEHTSKRCITPHMQFNVLCGMTLI